MAEGDAIADVMAWVTEAGLAGSSEADLLRGFCERASAAGLPLVRAVVIIDTLHPVHEGRVFRWRRDPSDERAMVEYGRTGEEGGPSADKWRQSPFYHLMQTDQSLLRRNLAKGDPADFLAIADLQAQGQTDYLAVVHRFGADGVIGEMDCVYSSWTTDAPNGFRDDQVDALTQALPALLLAVKCASLGRIAETLVETYLGRDAGRSVLGGRIARGVAERIEAVLWYSDLRSYTRISDTIPPEQIIPFLNDYGEAIISAIHEAGGDVLKLVGDGTLAIFKADDPAAAGRCALRAETLARSNIAAINLRRADEGLPVTAAYLGLHVGEVFYGNIGSRDRLDFTVVGPAVNEVSRIADLCRSTERDTLVSAAFREALHDLDRANLVSVGRYALRGVSRSQDLYTIEREG